MINDQYVIAARLCSGFVVGYNVPPAYRLETWQWLNGLSCVVNVWEESREKFAARRISAIDKGEC